MTQPHPVHALRARLRRHEPSLIINVDHPSAGLVEALARTDIQAVMFDTEQGSPDIESLENMARAARLHGTCSLIRTFNAEPWAIERLALRGADGLIVPRAESMDDVRRIVDAFDYCVPTRREDRMLVVQLEHANLLPHLDELARIDAIDCIFIGPVDLSKSMGHRGRYDVPRVADAIGQAIRALRGGGMPVGTLVKPGDVQPWVRLGVSFLYAHANDFISLGAAALRTQAGTT
ncbi:HpcH/HpaI aldolase family protein [Castellaniella sp. WN]